MEYTVQKLATLAGTSVRTLHYYDEIGLLSPARIEKNGYRRYGETELLRLQQILFFRELEFPLEEVKKIMESPSFDMKAALLDHKKLIELKKKRLSGLVKTIDATLNKLEKNKKMEDKDLYGNFSKEEYEQHQEEAKARWGNTDAWKQSQERTKNFTKEDYARLAKDGAIFMERLASKMPFGPKSAEVQEMIGQHYASLRTFYEPNLEMYRGLGEMYVADPRFRKYYEKFGGPTMPEFMRDAMAEYCEKNA